MLTRLKEIISYRDMVWSLVKRDLRGRYKGSFFGFLWNFINPLCQIVVYIIVFSNIFRNDIDKYYVFLVVGMMPWNFFSESLGQGSGCIVHQADMAKKIYFPREVLPLSTVTSRFVNMCLTFIVMFIIIAVSGIGFSFSALKWLPIIMLGEYIIALGLTTLLSAITVYFRDIEHITGVVLMAWIWATPIMYSANTIDGWVSVALRFNPMTYVINAYQSVLYYKTAPMGRDLELMFIFATCVLVFGELIFYRLEGGFAEEL